ncbi:N-terminal asparagine amidohydrolase [Olea europaea subsp. europaea]|uniref:N-terminal asparagine amidohydrolase n=2 Tax=Olea europaea subsp. europaea TaxID=158383 RepID=A0A8S0PY91_OLEEU|nr:N-terminal asparagine amidohydrolase [Olea europaea subsp. europaea]
MEHPILVSASSSFKFLPERKFSAPEPESEASRKSKWVYIFQREYAIVDSALVDFVGTDEATTCVGLVIHNPKHGMTSVAHLDSPNVVDIGLSQMLSLVSDYDSDAMLDVHLIGGFDDTSSKNANLANRSSAKLDGYSYSLCAKIIETLRDRNEKFQIHTLHVLQHNTRWDPDGTALPIFSGFVVETSTGSIIPASFDRTSRCPDEIVRRIRVTACYRDPNWDGRLLETYDTKTDHFVIAPCTWSTHQLYIAMAIQELSDAEILLRCSTSPSAESPDFVENERRQCDYLIRHPLWRETFPHKQPRIFQRIEGGSWVKC